MLVTCYLCKLLHYCNFNKCRHPQAPAITLVLLTALLATTHGYYIQKSLPYRCGRTIVVRIAMRMHAYNFRALQA